MVLNNRLKGANYMEEIFDVYTRDGKYIGPKEKSICHSPNPGFYHKPVWIWIVNSDNKILVQKRAACKKNNPNKWDMSSAGHVLAGETPIEGAIRETYEELGVKTVADNYEFICEYISDETFELAQVYLLRLDINNFNLPKEEVAEVKWLTYDEFVKLFYSNDFVKFADDYRKIVLELLKKVSA